jgi:hypothetical protein
MSELVDTLTDLHHRRAILKAIVNPDSQEAIALFAGQSQSFFIVQLGYVV